MSFFDFVSRPLYGDFFRAQGYIGDLQTTELSCGDWLVCFPASFRLITCPFRSMVAQVCSRQMRCPCICAGGPPADPLFVALAPGTTLTSHPITPPTRTQLTSCSWLYLIFFNGLWVVFPIWILWEAYCALSAAMSQTEMVDLVNYLKKDD